MLPSATELDRLTAPGAFLWATGVEDTFITDPHPRTGRMLDEYELTDHYRRWKEDIALMAQ
ncbi:MAG: glycoside hydrolase, partial [Methylocystis sp.]